MTISVPPPFSAPAMASKADDGLAAGLERALNDRIGEQRYGLWFRGHTRFRADGNTLVVGVPNLHYQEWLHKQFSAAIQEAANAVLDRPVAVRFRIDPELFQASRTAQAEAAPPVCLEPPTALPTPAPPPLIPPSARPKPGPVKRQPTPGLFDQLDAKEAQPQRSMPKRRWHHLGEFVVGAGNRVAHASAVSLVEEPGQGPNPLLLHGPVGTGKTHLLEGIFAGLKRRNPVQRVLYITAEEFTNRFIAAMRFGKQSAFRRHFRTCDVLLLDDLHFLAKKKATQEEFLHTFDALLDDGRPVVTTCDCHPRLNEDFLPELLDRMLGGAIWGLLPPDAETRLAMLRAKCGRGDGVPKRPGEEKPKKPLLIPDEVLQFLAENLRGNVRELEGALHSLRHYSRVLNRPVDVALAREALGDLLRHTVRVVHLSDVDAAVCTALRLSTGALQSQARTWAVSHPRMLAVYLCRKHTAASYAEISQYFGGKSHTAAVAAEKKVRGWLQENQSIALGGREYTVRDVLERIEREGLKK